MTTETSTSATSSGATETAMALAAARNERLALLPLASSGPTGGLFRGTGQSLIDVWRYRELLLLLVRRELKARYKDSSLGFLWSLLRPLALLVVYYVAIGKFLGAERSIPQFAVYVFTGLTAWTFFSEVIASGTGSIVNNGGLIKKVYLPREVFPLSVIGSALFSMLMQGLVLLAAVIVAGSFPTGSRWFYFPLAVGLLTVWGAALAFVLSAVNVYLRDVQYLVEIALMTAFWASPVVYSWEQVSGTVDGLLLDLYLLNPVTVAVLGMQEAFWVAGSDKPIPSDLGLRMGIMLVLGLVLVWAAQRLFSRLECNFAQEI